MQSLPQDPPLERHPPDGPPPVVHPLARLITDASAGRFPAADGGWRRVPVWRPGLEGIIAFTGHAVLALAPDISDERLAGLGVDGFGGAQDPRVVTAIAGPAAWIDSLDVLMAARGAGGAAGPGPGRTGAGLAGGGPEPAPGGRLTARPDLAGHRRAQFDARIRDRRLVLGYPDRQRSAVVVVSTGLAGL